MADSNTISPTLRNIDRLCRLLGVAIAPAILLGGFSVDRLVANRTAEMIELRKTAEDTASCAEAVRQEIESLASRQTAANLAVRSLEDRLPRTAQESVFNAGLAEAAAVSGLKIETFRPGRRVAINGLGELDIQISCRGSYAAHCDFLDQLRSLPRVCPVDRMKITAADDHGAELFSEIQIRLLYGDAALLTSDAVAGATP